MISVIVALYNVEDYLKRCVDSILSQTYGDFELILVDDGSLDSSGRICDEYAARDCRVKVIHKANGGVGSGRNAGLDVAQGEYISFLDSDDWIEPDFLEVMLNMLEEYDADISQVYFIKETETAKDQDFEVVREETVRVYEGREIMGNLFRKGTGFRTILVWNKLYRRELFEGIRYPEHIVFDDEARTHEVLYRAKRMVVNDSTLYHYTWRDNSISNNSRPLKYLDLVQAIEMRLNFFAERGEEEYYLQTVSRYARELLRTGQLFYFCRENGPPTGPSNGPLTGRDGYAAELMGKLEANMEAFKCNPYIRLEHRVALALYRVSPGLGFSAHRGLGHMKAILKKGLKKGLK